MACQVYYWTSESIKNKSFGHISMQTGNGTYISFWPENVPSIKHYKKGVVSSCWISSLEEEIKKYKSPDFTITVPDMDNNAIDRWFADFRKQEPKWNLHSHSCSSVVYNALCAGSSKFCKSVKKYIPVTTPGSLFRMIEAITSGN